MILKKAKQDRKCKHRQGSSAFVLEGGFMNRTGRPKLVKGDDCARRFISVITAI